MQILVSVSLLPVHSEGTIRVMGNQSVKEGELPILLRLHNKLEVCVKRVKMRGGRLGFVPGEGQYMCHLYSVSRMGEGLGRMPGLVLQHLSSSMTGSFHSLLVLIT